ncbi:hypothetical protein [Paracoccus endophyticus]|uniref:hypothetical protein n=1 Tax=Paracoccus endophyticus TaxID=2233774 RepID=UPI001F0C8933|nr:hypothetical protein [Paracoccus endophyticus]
MSGAKGYKDTLRDLQVELVKLQRHVIKNDLRILILFEGRDAAGKDGVIKRITEHLSPRDTRVVALGKPSDRDRQLQDRELLSPVQTTVAQVPSGGATQPIIRAKLAHHCSSIAPVFVPAGISLNVSGPAVAGRT